MTSKNSRLHDQLSRYRTLIGLLHMRLNPALVEMASECGYNFLILDGQRGMFSEREFLESLDALVVAKNVLSLVRLPGHDMRPVDGYLEMGADGIVVPHVSTADEARAVARAMNSKQSASLIVILESVLGATHAEEILSIEGVDGAFVGPVNLSTDLGHPRDYAHPPYEEALSRIERAAAATGKVLGTVPNERYPVE